MKSGNKLLILLVIVALTAGTFVGTALADSCSKVHGHSSSECGPNNCCGCGHGSSTCRDCDPDESCSTSVLSGKCPTDGKNYLDWSGGANCYDC